MFPHGVTTGEDEVPPEKFPPGVTTGDGEVPPDPFPPGDGEVPPALPHSPGFTPTRTVAATLGASCRLIEAEGP